MNPKFRLSVSHWLPSLLLLIRCVTTVSFRRQLGTVSGFFVLFPGHRESLARADVTNEDRRVDNSRKKAVKYRIVRKRKAVTRDSNVFRYRKSERNRTAWPKEEEKIARKGSSHFRRTSLFVGYRQRLPRTKCLVLGKRKSSTVRTNL